MGSTIPPEKKNLLLKQFADLPADFVEDHLDRLDSEYFNQFTTTEIHTHLTSILELQQNPFCQVHLNQSQGDSFDLTLTAFDAPGLFAILCGLLTLGGFNIQSGHIFTYRKREGGTSPEGNRERRHFLEQKKCIDTLKLTHSEPRHLPENTGEQLQFQLNHYLKLAKAKQFQEVRYQLHKRIGNYLSQRITTHHTKLLPVDIKVDFDDQYTYLAIKGEDTPAFLYSLANALALKEINIHKVHIQTEATHVDDIIAITDRYDRPITSQNYLDKLRAAVVLIKQFTLFLPLAPDSDQAMRQFDLFLDDMMSEQQSGWSILNLEEANILALFAKLFGTGTFLCEQFMKMQYQTFLPLLTDLDQLRYRKSKEDFAKGLKQFVGEGVAQRESLERINRYKDQELFRIDLAHVVYPGKTFIQFSEELCDLAQVILTSITDIHFQSLVQEYGRPECNGQPCRFALVALGKFGGRELGYASDIELVCIYEGRGFCSGAMQPMTNSEFFNLLIQRFNKSLQVKADGIFNVDLRLRPHGQAGPLASSLNRWIDYYEPEGKAFDYERQSLLKLRPFYGDAMFCQRIVEERDRLIFGENEVPTQHTLELRRQQIDTLVKPGSVNAKYSRGGLVDIEYLVQFLQLKDGRRYQELRVTNTVRAMEILLELKCITPSEFAIGYNGYAFLRRLINALRMVRGNARDLEIPEQESDEYQFLARRLGYIPRLDSSPVDLLRRDLEEHFRNIASFFSRRFLSESDAAPYQMQLPELLTEDAVAEEDIRQVFEPYGFTDNAKIYALLRDLMESIQNRTGLLAIGVMMFRHISVSPDPDRVVLYFDKYIRNARRIEGIFKKMQYHPRYLELLVLLFGHSETLSSLLIQEPELIDFVTDPANLFQARSAAWFHSEIQECINGAGKNEDVFDRIRYFRNRQLVRIGLRDIYLGAPLVEIVRELSDLADSVLKAVYQEVFAAGEQASLESHQAVVALGKLGGRELNYSSDVDIVFVCRNNLAGDEQQQLSRLCNRFLKELMKMTPLGQLFRVDTTLRPYGTQGALMASVEHYLTYYRKHAQGWEYPVWLKARTVCGNQELGHRLILKIQDQMLDPSRQKAIRGSMISVRQKLLDQLKKEGIADQDIKSGIGGIRTIEFYVQRLQVQHGMAYPEILSGNTLDGLEKLLQARLLSPDRFNLLRESYLFFRKIEHRLQMEGMQQRHLIYQDPVRLRQLARRVGFEDRLAETAVEQFQGALKPTWNEIALIGRQWLQQ